MLDAFRQDLRYAVRTLARRPGFAAAAVATLALGIGANAAILTVTRAVLWDELPYPDADRIVILDGRNRDPEPQSYPASYLDIQDYRERVRSFEEISARSWQRNFNFTQGDEAERVVAELVQSPYFSILGARPLVGRTLGNEEDAPGIHRTAVIGHDLWQRRFGGRREVVGETLVLDGAAYDIVGVLPEGFRGLTDGADLWLPMTLASSLYAPAYLENRRFRWMSGVARLRPGVTLETAQAELDRITTALEREQPASNLAIGAALTPLSELFYGDLGGTLLLLLGAAACVLLIACANVANLQLARAVSRRREVAVRVSLGASRTRLGRQFLTESLVLALAGCAAGLLLSVWTTRALVARSAVAFPSFIRFSMDATVIGTMMLLALVAAVVFGAAPALLAARTRLTAVLKEGVRGSGPGFGRLNLQSGLVVAEIALALVLFIGGGLMVKGFRELRSSPLGFDAADVLTARMDMKGETFADDETYRTFARQLVERVAALRGVRAAALSGPALPTSGSYGLTLVDEGAAPAAGSTTNGVFTNYHLVSPDYFATLRLPLHAGRTFTNRDYDRARSEAVIVLSESAARALFGSGNPIGRRVRGADSPPESPWITVIGTVADARQGGLGLEAPQADVYLPLYQVVPRFPPLLNLMVKLEPGAGDVLAGIRDQVRSLQPGLPVFDARMLDDRLDDQAASARFLVMLIGVFAFLALVLAAVGIYGVISFTVASQVREVGIRMALGATRGRVLRLVILRGLRLAAVGIALGLAGAVAVTRLITSALYGVSPLDLTTFLATSAVLGAVAILAAAIPAARAARVEPLRALRAD
jgi:putative ABC transport system permease protein